MPTLADRLRSGPLWWIGLGLAFMTGTGGKVSAQARPSELRKVHALLVIDTLSGLG